MRRYTALTMSLTFVLSLSACDTSEIRSEITTEITERIQVEMERAEAAPSGLSDKEALVLFATLAEQGERTFWWYMDLDNPDLLIDEAAEPVEDCFRPVGRFDNIAELKQATEEVFTKRFCKTVLYPVGFAQDQGEGTKFVEIDGELYCNVNSGGMGWMRSLTGEMSVSENTYNSIVVTVVVEEPIYTTDGAVVVRQANMDFAMLREDGSYKLDNWYDYGNSYTMAVVINN